MLAILHMPCVRVFIRIRHISCISCISLISRIRRISRSRSIRRSRRRWGPLSQAECKRPRPVPGAIMIITAGDGLIAEMITVTAACQ